MLPRTALFAVVTSALSYTPPVPLRAMYSLATARTTRSATHAAASSTAGPPAVGPSPASNPSSTRKKRRAAGSPVDGEAATESTPSKKPRATPKKAAKAASASPVGGSGDEGGATAESKPRTTPKKFAAYLTTPYPDYARPTAEECEEVTRLLGDMHGLPQRPGQVEKLKEDGPVRVGEACESAGAGHCALQTRVHSAGLILSSRLLSLQVAPSRPSAMLCTSRDLARWRPPAAVFGS